MFNGPHPFDTDNAAEDYPWSLGGKSWLLSILCLMMYGKCDSLVLYYFMIIPPCIFLLGEQILTGWFFYSPKGGSPKALLDMNIFNLKTFSGYGVGLFLGIGLIVPMFSCKKFADLEFGLITLCLTYLPCFLVSMGIGNLLPYPFGRRD